MLFYQIKFLDPVLNDGSVSVASQVRNAIILVLYIIVLSSETSVLVHLRHEIYLQTTVIFKVTATRRPYPAFNQRVHKITTKYSRCSEQLNRRNVQLGQPAEYNLSEEDAELIETL
jgi:hypothetical protein